MHITLPFALDMLALCILVAVIFGLRGTLKKPPLDPAVADQHAAALRRGIEQVRTNIENLRKELDEGAVLEIKDITDALEQAEQKIAARQFGEALALIRKANWPVVMQIEEIRHEKQHHPTAKFTKVSLSFGDKNKD